LVIVPLAETPPPDRHPATIDDLVRLAPPHSLIYNADELPKGTRNGDWQFCSLKPKPTGSSWFRSQKPANPAPRV